MPTIINFYYLKLCSKNVNRVIKYKILERVILLLIQSRISTQ